MRTSRSNSENLNEKLEVLNTHALVLESAIAANVAEILAA